MRGTALSSPARPRDEVWKDSITKATHVYQRGYTGAVCKGTGPIKSNPAYVRTWLTGRLRHRETREIKARAHNKVPRVQGSWRTNVEPTVCTSRTRSCFTKRGTIFLHAISIIFRVLCTWSHCFDFLFAQLCKQVCLSKLKMSMNRSMLWMFYIVIFEATIIFSMLFVFFITIKSSYNNNG